MDLNDSKTKKNPFSERGQPRIYILWPETALSVLSVSSSAVIYPTFYSLMGIEYLRNYPFGDSHKNIGRTKSGTVRWGYLLTDCGSVLEMMMRVAGKRKTEKGTSSLETQFELLGLTPYDKKQILRNFSALL